MLSRDPQAVLARIRALCLALPETTEKISHGIPAFGVTGKMFAYYRHDHHGDGLTGVCLKTTGREEQALLIEADPDLYSWPAYLGPAGWVTLNLAPEDTDWIHVANRIGASWRLAAPKRLIVG